MKIWIEKKLRRTILLTLAPVCVLPQNMGFHQRTICNLLLTQMQLAQIKIEIGISKLNTHIPVKAPSFFIKGVGKHKNVGNNCKLFPKSVFLRKEYRLFFITWSVINNLFQSYLLIQFHKLTQFYVAENAH